MNITTLQQQWKCGLVARSLSLAFALVLSILSPPSGAQEDVIRFGASLSLTGNLAGEGKLVRDGYDFWVRHVNERGGIKVAGKSYKVEIKYYDDESNAKSAALLTEKLITEDGVKFILGPYGSGATFAASAVTEKYGIPMVAANAASSTIYDRGYKYIFAVLSPVDQYLGTIVKMINEMKPRPKDIAIIYENALFPQLSAESANEMATRTGLKVSYFERYPTGMKSFSSMLAQVRAKDPDVLLASGYTNDMILMVKQMRELKWKPAMVGFALGPTLPSFKEALGSEINGLLEPVQWAASAKWKDEIFGWTTAEYVEVFKKEFGYLPDYHPPQATAAAQVFQSAIQRADSLDPKRVRDEISRTSITTAYGPIKFNEKGVNIAKDMAVVQIQNDKHVVVFPKAAATGELIYPLPR